MNFPTHGATSTIYFELQHKWSFTSIDFAIFFKGLEEKAGYQ